MFDIKRGLSFVDSTSIIRIGMTILFLSILTLIIGYIWIERDRILSYFNTRIRRVFLFLIILATIGTDLSLVALIWGASDAVLDTVTSRIRSNVIVKTLTTIAILILTYLSTGILDSATSRLFTKDGTQVVDEHRREVIFRVTQITLYLLVCIGIFKYWNIDIGSVLIGAGALAAIIGLSARHTLNSVLAGTVLLFSRPFKVGDWICVGGEEGTVKRITIVNTILKTPSDEEVVIPNDVISEQKISNKTKSDKIRLSVDVGISYDADIDRITKIIESSAKKCKIVTDVPECSARVTSFDDSSVLISAQFWIREPSPRRRTTAKSVVRRHIKKGLEEENVDIPFPQRDINVPENKSKIFYSEQSQDGENKDDKDDDTKASKIKKS